MAGLSGICICCLIVAVSVYRREEEQEHKISMTELVISPDFGHGAAHDTVQRTKVHTLNAPHHVQNQSSSEMGMYGDDHITAGGDEADVDGIYGVGDEPRFARERTAGQSAGGPLDKGNVDGDGYLDDEETDSDHDVLNDEGGNPMHIGTTAGGPLSGAGDGMVTGGGPMSEDAVINRIADAVSSGNTEESSSDDGDAMDAMYDRGKRVTKGKGTTKGDGNQFMNVAAKVGDPSVTAGDTDTQQIEMSVDEEDGDVDEFADDHYET